MLYSKTILYLGDIVCVSVSKQANRQRIFTAVDDNINLQEFVLPSDNDV